MPSAEGETDYDCREFYVGRLGADLGSVVEGEEDGAVLQPVGALGDYSDPGIAFVVGATCGGLGRL